MKSDRANEIDLEVCNDRVQHPPSLMLVKGLQQFNDGEHCLPG